jgi:hypothetical protein
MPTPLLSPPRETAYNLRHRHYVRYLHLQRLQGNNETKYIFLILCFFLINRQIY